MFVFLRFSREHTHKRWPQSSSGFKFVFVFNYGVWKEKYKQGFPSSSGKPTLSAVINSTEHSTFSFKVKASNCSIWQIVIPFIYSMKVVHKLCTTLCSSLIYYMKLSDTQLTQ